MKFINQGYGKPKIANQGLSRNQTEALAAMKRNGKLIGEMVGSVGWRFRWLNSDISEPAPKTLTMKSLAQRALVFVCPHAAHPVIGECLWSDSWHDYTAMYVDGKRIG
jgi:hypothetical protein